MLADWIAFIDGACSGNPGPGGYAALLFHSKSKRIYKIVGSDKQTTNNRMEMLALDKVLEFALTPFLASELGAPKSKASFWIFSDSKLLIQGFNEWSRGWVAKGWKKSDGTPVMNQDLWESLVQKKTPLEKFFNWELSYVEAHAGIFLNECVDEWAVQAGKSSSAAQSQLLSESSEIQEFFAKAQALGNELGARAYLSQRLSGRGPVQSKSYAPKGPSEFLKYLVKDKEKILEFSDWATCEAYVKGRSGVRFKKVKNSAEEAAFRKGI